MMTIDEAIKHAEERAEDLRKEGIIKQNRNNADESVLADRCIKCAEEHEQLVEWLKELKQLREQTGWIPVSERLPEEYVPVMVSTKLSVFPEARCSKKYGWEWAYAAGDWRWLNNIVTAWMPLPEPYEVNKEEEMDKFDRQLLNDEIDMLKGNINRMCVTDDEYELYENKNFALIRLTNIAKMCDLRMKELKEKQMTQSNCCGDCGKCERSQLSTCLFPDRLESFIRHKRGE